VARLHLIGEDRGRGVLIAASPWMRMEDYRSQVDFAAALNRILLDCRGAGWLKGPSVIAFPFEIGWGLSLVDEWPWVYSAHSLKEALVRAALDEKAWSLAEAAFGPEEGRIAVLARRLFRLNRRKALFALERTLTGLAAQHGAWIAAGGPMVESGGGWGHSAVLAGPDGSLHRALQALHPLVSGALRLGSAEPAPSAARTGLGEARFPDADGALLLPGASACALLSISLPPGADGTAVDWKGEAIARAPLTSSSVRSEPGEDAAAAVFL
jgi:hypothetical protein